MAALLINNKDAYATWGVRMGDGFIDAIETPPTMKEYIENESRQEHGKRVVVIPKIDARDVTLPFTITGTSAEDYKTKKKAFEEELFGGYVDIQIPDNGDEVYHLLYKGKCTSYGHNTARTFGKFSAKFEEYNPNVRE